MTQNNFDWQKAAEAFYGEQNRKEKAEKEERNLLLSELKDNLTPAQKLYSSNENLRNMLKEKYGSLSAKITKAENNKYNYDDIINNPNLSKEEKLQSIKARGQKTENEIIKQGRKEIGKQIGLGAVEIGLTMLPAGKGVQVGGKIGQEILKKQAGRKVSNLIGQGAGAGAAAGGTQGAIEGIKKDNIIPETIKGSAIGLLSGIFGAGTIAKAEEKIRGQMIKNAPKINTMTNEARKNFRKQGEKFYTDYNQDVVVKNKDTGLDINIVKKGMEKSINRSYENIKKFPDLKNDLKKAKLQEKNELYKKRKDDAEEFYTFSNGDDYIHKTMKNKNMLKHYFTNKIKEQ